MKRTSKVIIKKSEPHGNIKYEEAFKLQVIREVLGGKISKAEAKRLYGIRSNSAILEWMRQYSGEKGYDKRGKVLKKTEASKSSKPESEQTQRILELEELLRIERLKVTLSNTMIDIAEEELGINIRKKSGAKQSKKLKQRKAKK